MHKNRIKFVRLYFISFICIVFYFILENSNIISELVQISEKGRYGGFPIFLMSGLLKYGLLVAGIAIIINQIFLFNQRKNK
jgi:hypothetical protein